MFLWRVFQLLLAFAGGSFIIYIGQSEGMKPNPILVGLFGIGLAYVVSVGLAKMIDFYRSR